jgi:hypothetical protein
MDGAGIAKDRNLSSDRLIIEPGKPKLTLRDQVLRETIDRTVAADDQQAKKQD